MRHCLARLLAVLIVATVGLAADEGTRHITGDGADMYFMNDKVFGTVDDHPLWAIYNCGTDIKGQMDVGGTYHDFSFVYHKEGERKITGTFGDHEMALGAVEKQESGFVYHVFIGDTEHLFTIRYEELADEHMLNSIIEGELAPDRPLKLTVDGHLCPFSTTGIILISAGSHLVD
jgi:hypothetical protein